MVITPTEQQANICQAVCGRLGLMGIAGAEGTYSIIEHSIHEIESSVVFVVSSYIYPTASEGWLGFRTYVLYVCRSICLAKQKRLDGLQHRTYHWNLSLQGDVH